MILSQRLRSIREQRNLTQGDIEQRTGLKRSYVSRLEHGRTIPSLATLEKFAQALEVPLYQFFYDGKEPPTISSLPPAVQVVDGDHWGRDGESARYVHRLSLLLRRLKEGDRQILVHFASQLIHRKKP
ncbi:MAG TPA: helix-turn-helix transcriptional regulator [Candidatus Acidoferrum sp.]